ncbi:hypothetical protein I302_104340 [Kwoniella bestiolae CBS 10118]|uniref:Uncharacterized protein n=1 Tax=Kwoniella bestiolae CBS 10118 TaxID=1296100 RepID=A0A1B9GAZ7_9TREE|nr:hypothetical protein I302_03048 [Kwoniella bestiolae CBS 10118]OCF28196.1 hypothetical protein I302_03048 [Kwoniella bestiolae CBS 10118]
MPLTDNQPTINTSSNGDGTPRPSTPPNQTQSEENDSRTPPPPPRPRANGIAPSQPTDPAAGESVPTTTSQISAAHWSLWGTILFGPTSKDSVKSPSVPSEKKDK